VALLPAEHECDDAAVLARRSFMVRARARWSFAPPQDRGRPVRSVEGRRVPRVR
jgi:hypothetical protein